MTKGNSDDITGRDRARFVITDETPPDMAPPAPFVPEHLLSGVFAHSVRTFSTGGNVLMDFSYHAPVSWHDGEAPEYVFEHIVVSRVLMPRADFEQWIRNAFALIDARDKAEEGKQR